MLSRGKINRIIAVLITAMLISECRVVTYAAQMPYPEGSGYNNNAPSGVHEPEVDLQKLLSSNNPFDTTENGQNVTQPDPAAQTEPTQDDSVNAPFTVPFAPADVQPVVDLQTLLSQLSNPLLNQGLINPQSPTAPVLQTPQKPVEQKPQTPVEQKPVVIPGSVSDSAISKYKKDESGNF